MQHITSLPHVSLMCSMTSPMEACHGVCIQATQSDVGNSMSSDMQRGAQSILSQQFARAMTCDMIRSHMNEHTIVLLTCVTKLGLLCLRWVAGLRAWGSCEYLAEAHAAKAPIPNLSSTLCSCHCNPPQVTVCKVTIPFHCDKCWSKDFDKHL